MERIDPEKLEDALYLVFVLLVVAAVVKELGRPPGSRAWHGTVAGLPYDFRRPSAVRIRRSIWAPDVPRVLVPRSLGLGWSVNLAQVVSRLRRSIGGARRS